MTWTSDQRLQSLATGSAVFAVVPRLQVPRRGPLFPEGPVHLKYGQHRGLHRGFGFQHTWKQHLHRIDDHDTAMTAVIQHIDNAFSGRAPLHYEAGQRLEVFRLTAGCVIIELRPEEGPAYSIISAGYATRNAKGSLVGALERAGSQ